MTLTKRRLLIYKGEAAWVNETLSRKGVNGLWTCRFGHIREYQIDSVKELLISVGVPVTLSLFLTSAFSGAVFGLAFCLTLWVGSYFL